MDGRRVAGVVVGLAIATLVGGIVWAVPQEPLSSGLRRIIEQPWGMVTLVDLYLGLAVFGLWVFLLQRTVLRSLPWWIALACLGNLATLVFVLYRLAFAESLREAVLGEQSRPGPGATG